MLTLMDAGWASVRSLAAHGHRPDALARLSRLLARPDLPASVAAEAHRLAGQLLIDAERYPTARRHLSAAAALEPSRAETFHLWGLAHEEDPHGCDHRAALRFRAACRLEPNNARYRAAFGRAAVRCDRLKTGVRELVAAADAAPGDLAVLRVVIDGFLEAGRFDTARRVLTRARFLCPADRELVALVERVRYEMARHEQGRTTRRRQDADPARDGGRVVLPFVRVDRTDEAPAAGGTVRRDVFSMPQPHFPRLRVRRADG
jgi:hypothetical protein